MKTLAISKFELFEFPFHKQSVNSFTSRVCLLKSLLILIFSLRIALISFRLSFYYLRLASLDGLGLDWWNGHERSGWTSAATPHTTLLRASEAASSRTEAADRPSELSSKARASKAATTTRVDQRRGRSYYTWRRARTRKAKPKRRRSAANGRPRRATTRPSQRPGAQHQLRRIPKPRTGTSTAALYTQHSTAYVYLALKEWTLGKMTNEQSLNKDFFLAIIFM